MAISTEVLELGDVCCMASCWCRQTLDAVQPEKKQGYPSPTAGSRLG